MSGLDNMKRQILDEANHSAETKIADAKAQADKILEEAKAEADTQAAKISGKSQEEIKNYAERIVSSCEMHRKQALLRAKQEVIAEVLDRAYERIISLDSAAYFELIKKMLQKYAQPEEGVVCFSAADLKRLPDGFETDIQNAASANGGALKLSSETKEMEGGFILVYGGIEENCTIKALFDAKRDELSDQVHGLLFS